MFLLGKRGKLVIRPVSFKVDEFPTVKIEARGDDKWSIVNNGNAYLNAKMEWQEGNGPDTVFSFNEAVDRAERSLNGG